MRSTQTSRMSTGMRPGRYLKALNERNAKIGKSDKKSKFKEHGALVHESLLTLRHNGGKTTEVHEHQVGAVLKTNKKINSVAFKKEPAPVLIVAPPGSGRSGIMVLLSYSLKSKKVLVITPSNDRSNRIGVAFGMEGVESSFLQKSELIREQKTLDKMLEPVSIVKSSKTVEEIGNLVIVRTDTLSSNNLEFRGQQVVRNAKQFFQQFDLLLVDEAERFQAHIWSRIMNEFGVSSERKLVFLTATSLTQSGLPILASQQVTHVISRKVIEGLTIRPCDFEERQKYDEDAFISYLKTILARQQRQEGRIGHQAMVLVRLQSEVDSLVTKLNSGSAASYAVGIYSGDTKNQKLDDFTAGKHRVAVVCSCLPEDYVNPKVSLCVILRKLSSPLLFSQFVGKCWRMVDLGERKDRTRACVLTYKKFEQRGLWDTRDGLFGEIPPGVNTKRRNVDDSDSGIKRRKLVSSGVVEGSAQSRSNVTGRLEKLKIFADALSFLYLIPGMATNSLSWCSRLQIVAPESNGYGDIVEYIKHGQVHGYGVKLLNLLRVVRANDPEFENDPQHRKTFRMMLWHGTKLANIPSILQNGFQLPPNKRQMFGTGIYFADRISKSCNYCGGTTPGTKAYLFLCDVLLGNVYNAKIPHREFTEPPKGLRQEFDSVMCTGRLVPDRVLNRRLHSEADGSIIPCGPTIVNTKFPSYILHLNEYVVYDPTKIKIKYLVQVEFTQARC